MKKRKRSHSEINYWQSNADLVTGFVLVLILIIMLLILYLVQIPENSEPDAVSGNTFAEDDWDGYGSDDWDHDDWGGGGGDGDGETEAETESETETGEYEYPYAGGGGGEDDWAKAAVYTTVIDGGTGRAIRQAGITFELYEQQTERDGGSKRFLYTYYPERTEYRSYETTDAGVFYLPEKIEEGYYYFEQITDVEGYDRAETTYFFVDDAYDWPDPFVVSIAIYPSRNIIPIQLEDAETHEPIEEGTFQVTAAEDIVTADETVRYAQNDLADTIIVGEDGYGESQELYLGTYLVTQDEVPQYYAGIPEGVETEVQQKTGSTPEAIVFSLEKTRIRLTLTDELYTNQRLEGAEFTLTCEGYPELTQTGVTDRNGELVFTDLEKGRTYILRQTSAPDNYKFEPVETEIYVDANGWINGEAEASYDLTNYIERVNIEVRSMLFGSPVSNISAALYNEAGEQIRIWTSSGSAETFENLPAGSYHVILGGNENRRYDFEIRGDEALQEISLSVWSLMDIAAIGLGIVAAAVVVLVLALLLKKGKKVSGKQQKEGEMNREE